MAEMYNKHDCLFKASFTELRKDKTMELQTDESAISEIDEVRLEEIPLREEEQGDFILCQCFF